MDNVATSVSVSWSLGLDLARSLSLSFSLGLSLFPALSLTQNLEQPYFFYSNHGDFHMTKESPVSHKMETQKYWKTGVSFSFSRLQVLGCRPLGESDRFLPKP